MGISVSLTLILYWWGKNWICSTLENQSYFFRDILYFWQGEPRFLTSGLNRLGKININVPLCNIGNWLGRVCKSSFVPKLAEFVSSSGCKLQRIHNSIDLKVQESSYHFWHDCYLLVPSSKLKRKGKRFWDVRRTYLLIQLISSYP